jgi:hypothetical protein
MYAPLASAKGTTACARDVISCEQRRVGHQPASPNYLSYARLASRFGVRDDFAKARCAKSEVDSAGGRRMLLSEKSSAAQENFEEYVS